MTDAVIVLSLAVLGIVAFCVQQCIGYEKRLSEMARNHNERVAEVHRFYERLIASEKNAAKADLHVHVYRASVQQDRWLAKHSKSLVLAVVIDNGVARDVVGDIDYLSVFNIPPEIKQAIVAALVGAVKVTATGALGVPGLPV